MKVAIMTDTNSGISVAEGQSMGVYVIPMPVLIEGNIVASRHEFPDGLILFPEYAAERTIDNG